MSQHVQTPVYQVPAPVTGVTGSRVKRYLSVEMKAYLGLFKVGNTYS